MTLRMPRVDPDGAAVAAASRVCVPTASELPAVGAGRSHKTRSPFVVSAIMIANFAEPPKSCIHPNARSGDTAADAVVRGLNVEFDETAVESTTAHLNSPPVSRYRMWTLVEPDTGPSTRMSIGLAFLIAPSAT